jgi:hypothetical protein
MLYEIWMKLHLFNYLIHKPQIRFQALLVSNKNTNSLSSPLILLYLNKSLRPWDLGLGLAIGKVIDIRVSFRLTYATGDKAKH